MVNDCNQELRFLGLAKSIYYAVLLEEMEIISRVESFDCVTAYL